MNNLEIIKKFENNYLELIWKKIILEKIIIKGFWKGFSYKMEEKKEIFYSTINWVIKKDEGIYLNLDTSISERRGAYADWTLIY